MPTDQKKMSYLVLRVFRRLVASFWITVYFITLFVDILLLLLLLYNPELLYDAILELLMLDELLYDVILELLMLLI